MEIISTNPAVKAIISGSAPRPAMMAAARGMLPLAPADLLEVLAFLSASEDSEVAQAAAATFGEQTAETLADTTTSLPLSVNVLQFLATRPNLDARVYENVFRRSEVPDEAVLHFARATRDGSLLELLTVNQQRLVRVPALIQAIIGNPSATAEARRRAEEIKQEFFEKKLGAEQIAAELRARGNEAAAEFFEQAELAQDIRTAEDITDDKTQFSYEDVMILAEHIEVGDDEIDDSWLDLDLIEEIYEESEEVRRAYAEVLLADVREKGEISAETITILEKLMRANVKDRVKYALKGDAMVRGFLMRDPNKVVIQGVISNPRITDQEIEKISAMRSVPDIALRQIALNRAWLKKYTVIHNLVRNPRCPLPIAMQLMPRLQAKDLKTLSQSRNVPEAIRRHAGRLCAGKN